MNTKSKNVYSTWEGALVSSAFEFLQKYGEPIPEQVSGSLIHLVRLIDQAQTADQASLQFCVDLTRFLEALRANPMITVAVLQHVVDCRERFTWITKMLLKHPTIPVNRKGRIVDRPIQEVGDKEIRDFLLTRYNMPVKVTAISQARARFFEDELQRLEMCLAAEEAALDLMEKKEKDCLAKNPAPRQRNPDFLWHLLQEQWKSVELIGVVPDKLGEALLCRHHLSGRSAKSPAPTH